YLPIHIFLTDYFYKIELPGPYRHIEKGLLLLFHIVKMLLYKYVNMGDCILVDGGYTLHIPNTIDKINAKGYNIDIESFAFPFRKSIGEDLSVQQALFNKQINSLRSSIETFFHHFTNDFERFNKHNIIRITEKSLYNLQLNFAAVIFNLKNSCKVYDADNDIYKDIYKNWTEKNFEYKYENDEVVEEV
ncbi:hypothetical protein EDC94DRAFT_502755, partial [Helicostylum pulchrum]